MSLPVTSRIIAPIALIGSSIAIIATGSYVLKVNKPQIKIHQDEDLKDEKKTKEEKPQVKPRIFSPRTLASNKLKNNINKI